MGQAPLRRRVWDSSNAGQWAYPPVGQSGLPTYPLKPSHAVSLATSRYESRRNQPTASPPREFGVRAVGPTSYRLP